MSDGLTRYTAGVRIHRQGEFVKAEEAEARIGELVLAGSLVEAKLEDAEARIAALVKDNQWAGQELMKREARIEELEAMIEQGGYASFDPPYWPKDLPKIEARLRAADELADKIEALIHPGTVVAHEHRMLDALTAYREAGK
jgi:multidrug resistance efflux pump